MAMIGDNNTHPILTARCRTIEPRDVQFSRFVVESDSAGYTVIAQNSVGEDDLSNNFGDCYINGHKKNFLRSPIMFYQLVFPYYSPLLIVIVVVAALWFSNDFSTKFSLYSTDDTLSTCLFIARVLSNDSNVHWPGVSSI